MASDSRTAIEKRLAEYLAGPGDELAPLARRYNALPVYRDIGGTLFLSPSGEVLSLGQTDENTLRPEKSVEWRTVAAVAAAERYPELSCLLPVRPTSTSDCATCGGSGRVAPRNLRCGNCWGLGWKLAL